jgi:predicted PilT family ATPase
VRGKIFEISIFSCMFGQVVVGPPGSGKSTYCSGVRQFLNGIER